MGGRAVEICDTLRIRAIVRAALEIGQLRTFAARHRGEAEARFGRTEQENFCRQAVRAAGDGRRRAAAFAVRELYLLDGVLDVRLEQVQERAVQVGMDGAVGIIVGVQAVPCTVFIDVLHQKPCAVAAIVIDAGRLALMDNDEVSGRTIYFQLDGAADCFGT